MTKNRKPIGLHLLEGNKNRLTKEEIQQRQSHEESMKADTDKVIPPSRLTKAQKEKFVVLSGQLMELGIFDNLDVDTLAMYIETYDNYIRVNRSAKSMTAKQLKEDFKDYAQRMRTASQLAAVCRQLAGDLGLTITSRLKLVIPENEEKGDSPMAKFLKSRGNDG
ncbi:phage terminase small subunit P27 family [Sporosarcina newyorkensis]|uniref:phage terminase small subunit P27 family n=1 Tax=Sporosarcina newyorkensis TaxID=759851 RepID=UPI003D0953E5